MKYDVIIIGAGPGGIFAAYELMKKKPDCKIAVFEEGYPLEKRKCPIDGEKVKSCINCKRCSIMCGFGGAGAFSDGKYNITNDFGELYLSISVKSRLLSCCSTSMRSIWKMVEKGQNCTPQPEQNLKSFVFRTS